MIAGSRPNAVDWPSGFPIIRERNGCKRPTGADTEKDRNVTTTFIVLVTLGIIAALVAVTLLAKIALGLIKRPLEARIAYHYKAEEVLMKDLAANCFGLESAGIWQVRGNGGLVLTENELHFFMFLPRKEIRVPLDTITEITMTKSHLGKATIYTLLKVRFTEQGKPNSVAWYLTDPQAWKTRIEQLEVI